MSQEITTKVVEIVIAAVSVLITTVLVPALSNWIKSKTENQKARTAIDSLSYAVNTAVDYVEQTMVTQLKKDGKWDTASQEVALQRAATIAMGQLSTAATDYLTKNGNDIKDTIIKYIEANILSKKNNTLLVGECIKGTLETTNE